MFLHFIEHLCACAVYVCTCMCTNMYLFISTCICNHPPQRGNAHEIVQRPKDAVVNFPLLCTDKVRRIKVLEKEAAKIEKVDYRSRYRLFRQVSNTDIKMYMMLPRKEEWRKLPHRSRQKICS